MAVFTAPPVQNGAYLFNPSDPGAPPGGSGSGGGVGGKQIQTVTGTGTGSAIETITYTDGTQTQQANPAYAYGFQTDENGNQKADPTTGLPLPNPKPSTSAGTKPQPARVTAPSPNDPFIDTRDPATGALIDHEINPGYTGGWQTDPTTGERVVGPDGYPVPTGKQATPKPQAQAGNPSMQYLPSGEPNPNYGQAPAKPAPQSSPSAAQNADTATRREADTAAHNTATEGNAADRTSIAAQNADTNKQRADQQAARDAAKQAADVDLNARKDALAQSTIDMNNARAATQQAKIDWQTGQAQRDADFKSGKLSHDDYVAQTNTANQVATNAANDYRDQLTAYADAQAALTNAANTAEKIRADSATEYETAQNNAAQRNLQATQYAQNFGEAALRDEMSWRNAHGSASPQFNAYLQGITNSNGTGPTPAAPAAGTYGHDFDTAAYLANGVAFALANQSQAARDHIAANYPGSSGTNPFVSPNVDTSNPAATAQTAGATTGPGVSLGGPAGSTASTIAPPVNPFTAPMTTGSAADTSGGQTLDTTPAPDLTDTSSDTDQGLQALNADNPSGTFTAPPVCSPDLCTATA